MISKCALNILKGSQNVLEHLLNDSKGLSNVLNGFKGFSAYRRDPLATDKAAGLTYLGRGNSFGDCSHRWVPFLLESWSCSVWMSMVRVPPVKLRMLPVKYRRA